MAGYGRPHQSASKSRGPVGINIRLPSFELFAFRHKRSLTFGDERGLNNDEYAIAEPIFKQAIDYTWVRVVKAAVANSPTVLGNYIRVSKGGPISPSILIHELAHIWQYQTKGLRYISSSVCQQLSTIVDRPTIKTGFSIHDYKAEEQAMIISDYYVYKQYEKIVSELKNKGKLLRSKNGKVALLPIAERKEIDLNDDDLLKKIINSVVKHEKDYDRMIAEVQRSRPLSKAILQQIIVKDNYWQGTDTKPPTEKRQLQPNPLIRIEF
jgi:hypothetical protein